MASISESIESLCRAMVSADKLTLESLTAQELSYGHTSGLIENKTEFINAIVGNDRRDVFHWINLSDHAIIISGDTAIARHQFQAEVLVNGVLAQPNIRVIQTWQHKQGEWKLLARQAFKA